MAKKKVSPRFGGGSGLKLCNVDIVSEGTDVSPRFGGGSGLKPDQ